MLYSIPFFHLLSAFSFTLRVIKKALQRKTTAAGTFLILMKILMHRGRVKPLKDLSCLQNYLVSLMRKEPRVKLLDQLRQLLRDLIMSIQEDEVRVRFPVHQSLLDTIQVMSLAPCLCLRHQDLFKMPVSIAVVSSQLLRMR